MGHEQKDPTHTANYGVGLKEKCAAAGVECHLIHRGAVDVKYPTMADFLLAKLKAAK